MVDRQLHRARLISSVAATVISLACGTNYVYSAWAPQFADKLHLTTTESNLIGLAGNLGMYSMGVPVGLFIDHRGPRPAVIAGALLLGLGYFPFRSAFDSASGSVALLCFFSYLSGLGGCMAFAASVKTSALNWPHHRGTATAFPLAAFGLSAFFFSVFGSFFFPGNTSAFLMVLAAGTSGLTFFGFFFLRVFPHTSYHTVPSTAGLSDSQQLRRTSSEDAKAPRRGRGLPDVEPGMSPTNYTTPVTLTQGMGGAEDGLDQEPPSTSRGGSATRPIDVEAARAPHATDEPEDIDETSSLMSKSSSLPGDVLVQNSVDMDRSHRIDIRGWRLLSNVDFWQLFAIMGILAGIGLMTINNIGHDVNALWKRYDDSVSEAFLIQRQQMHVSILSVGSFLGRLLSGVGSDFLVKILGASRAWCLVVASFVFFIAQIFAINIANPHFLGFVSGLSGLGYGFLFGVFPSIVAETFGIHGLSQNWGFMTLSPVISGNIFNLFYGTVFDSHSVVGDGGERSCPDGLDCYRNAYFVTLGACGLGLLVTLSTIRHQYQQRLKEDGKGPAED
ncbi:major facilitator superfamily domain-containing protein [Lasiosphaeria miniovina]|uniref:Major facilitator superfamily domain-containing protein n=1 Tax=Lasiosphaeria miniovina TaxID=1954250 RepID=A0AA40AUD4_9PEZI|nr:major facilitator superfamily domain-containing protein [Lasiosphaeria miniovina]KAK0722127.1 major facilitator superfamily domain-containing protein [Lasiosphaeria miniovina]